MLLNRRPVSAPLRRCHLATRVVASAQLHVCARQATLEEGRGWCLSGPLVAHAGCSDRYHLLRAKCVGSRTILPLQQQATLPLGLARQPKQRHPSFPPQWQGQAAEATTNC